MDTVNSVETFVGVVCGRLELNFIYDGIAAKELPADSV